MTIEELQKANQGIKTTDVKGKEYAEVNQRIKAFRSICPNGAIESEILSVENGVCIIKSTVSDENGKVLGVGHAYEREGSSYINKTSFIENCETSAVGRALGMCGIGIDTSVASYEEVANAVEQQKSTAKQEKQTDYVKTNANYASVIATKKGITAKEVMEKAMETAGTDNPEAVCKVLCDWMRKVKQ
ncbi:MAG: hypothetical protein ACI4LI_02175 [Candidatus Fimenecus sp.]